MTTTNTTVRRLAGGVLWLALIAGLVLTWFDGVRVSLAEGMFDFSIVYAGTSLFVDGASPYFVGQLSDIIGPILGDSAGVQITLPGVFALMSPFVLLEHHIALQVWAGLNLIAMLGIAWLLLRLTAIRLASFHGLLLMAGYLLLGTFRMSLRRGQVDILILFFTLLAVYLLWLNRFRIGAALLLAIAIVLKPTNAGLFSVYVFFRGRAWPSVVSLVASGGFIVVCAVYLSLVAPGWIGDWSAAVAAPENDFNRAVETNPRVYLLTHLAAGVFALTDSLPLGTVLGYGVCIPVFLRLCFSTPYRSDVDKRQLYLLELAIVAMVTLLIIYHRFYSGVLLVFPFAWAVYCVANGHRGPIVWATLSMPLFTVVNGQAAWFVAVNRGLIPGVGRDDDLVNAVFGYHYVWLQLLLLLLLAIEHWRQTRFMVRELAYR